MPANSLRRKPCFCSNLAPQPPPTRESDVPLTRTVDFAPCMAARKPPRRSSFPRNLQGDDGEHRHLSFITGHAILVAAQQDDFTPGIEPRLGIQLAPKLPVIRQIRTSPRGPHRP